MRYCNSLDLGINSLGHRVERTILKNSPMIAEYILMDTDFYEAFLQLIRERSIFFQRRHI